MSAKKLLKGRGLRKTAKKTAGSARANNGFTYEELINAESALGRTLFGPVPEGHQREFFESKPNVWIWHESFVNQLGRMEEMTIRYEVRPTGVYKKPMGGTYERLQGDELDNFRRAARSYLALVKSKLYC
ncbi:hypothetical protein IKD67_00445 [Candidatus Saccharibacteria bacterium]|nr:hypothetical protein [Candidatus Saccharibacteria bacterium]